ncbi:hypothetical protein IMZ48_48480 [Candidatus Bathyarchaeota archaeon]|nr:hypothetical protein [Candidatus Bathyarchaeota archaeon]
MGAHGSPSVLPLAAHAMTDGTLSQPSRPAPLSLPAAQKSMSMGISLTGTCGFPCSASSTFLATPAA